MPVSTWCSTTYAQVSHFDTLLSNQWQYVLCFSCDSYKNPTCDNCHGMAFFSSRTLLGKQTTFTAVPWPGKEKLKKNLHACHEVRGPHESECSQRMCRGAFLCDGNRTWGLVGIAASYLIGHIHLLAILSTQAYFQLQIYIADCGKPIASLSIGAAPTSRSLVHLRTSAGESPKFSFCIRSDRLTRLFLLV